MKPFIYLLIFLLSVFTTKAQTVTLLVKVNKNNQPLKDKINYVAGILVFYLIYLKSTLLY